ncbi:MAG TPA: tetratricopeptide repeat protein [Chloroflexia bacterium]|jgi:tetratricopeptide (TPR) repeat protein
MGNMNIGDVKSERDTIISSVITNLYQGPTPTITSLHQLRAPVADFVGRELEIDRLVQALRGANGRGEAAIAGIRGLNGMGKTELAYAVAQRLKDTFPDAQLLLELHGAGSNPMTTEQALQTIIRAFDPRAQLPNNLNALRSIYLTLLTGKRVLVLADDVWAARQVESLLPPPGCALLLTSGQRFVLVGMVSLDLNVLPQLEAEQLLLRICPSIGSTAARMAQLCGRLPLALRMCASICANSTMSVEYHLKALEDERERLSHLRDPDLPNTSVEASLQLSYDALDPQAQHVLCQLSVFSSSFDITSAKAVVQRPGEGQETTAEPWRVEDVLGLLYRRSLVDQDRETKRFSLHDLVRVFGLERLEGEGEGEEAMRLRHAQYYAVIAGGADELYLRGGENVRLGLKLFDMERANIDAGWGWAREQASQQAGSLSQDIDELLVDYAYATIYVGDLRYDKRRERIPQLEAALTAARRLNYKEAESMALGNLGAAYKNLGEPRKAIEYYEQALKLAQEIADHRGEGFILGSLGLAYMDLGETHKAIQYFEEHLQMAREMGDRQGEGNALGNLGIAYKNLGETHKAIQHYEHCLQIAREIGDRRSESIAIGSLGIAYVDLGETHEAIQCYEQCLQIAQEMGDLRGEAITRWNLGLLLAKEGDLIRAIELMQVTVDYEREIGHIDAEEHAVIVDRVRKG